MVRRGSWCRRLPKLWAPPCGWRGSVARLSKPWVGGVSRARRSCRGTPPSRPCWRRPAWTSREERSRRRRLDGRLDGRLDAAGAGIGRRSGGARRPSRRLRVDPGARRIDCEPGGSRSAEAARLSVAFSVRAEGGAESQIAGEDPVLEIEVGARLERRVVVRLEKVVGSQVWLD